MTGDPSLLAAVLTVVSVVSLSLLSLLCLRCKKKSMIIHEEHQIYNPQTFQRGGSVFAVTQSKRVTRTNQIPSTTVEVPEPFSPDDDYQNIEDVSYNVGAAHTGSPKHIYVAPLAMSVYENEQTNKGRTEDDQTLGVYANINDDDDYENAGFLNQVMEEEDNEPDYVNENGEGS
ncbi:hypothetical protein D9C73_017385 [Collichthys lucidus]|uniref:Linker for activation of T-cells family member 2 n=1 Tax=Collichthys lucidus TaxID=240159 RepID=A0A4U5V986_COLLU|nr:hypothetical protein D9C73_017385 [Collichthys lucidus]